MATDEDRRAFVEKVRQENTNDFGPGARRAVQKLLSAGLPHPWMYVYELTQNARDAGARRVAWRANGDTVVFQHDGDIALDESHVRGIASLGASTKGLAAVGFMGVGFKSVFARFRQARVSGFGWRFGFSVGTRRGDIDSTVTEWFDTLLPNWDDAAPEPDDGYTTAFLLEQPADRSRPTKDDLDRIASPEDPTPLAVLALRGLQRVTVGDVAWDLAVRDGVVEVRCSELEKVWRWKSFVSCYRPDDDAMRRFLEVRQETQDQVDAAGQRVEREVVGLLPLDSDGQPKPLDHGRVYATLPTQVQVPFGFHLQADWLVNVDRQNLREVVGDPWQEAIVRQVPEIVRQLLMWLAGDSAVGRKGGYHSLRDPSTDDGLLSQPFQKLRDDLVTRLGGLGVVPVHGAETRRFCSPEEVARLPGQFLVNFGRRPAWRPDILFGCDLMDESLLGMRATAFARWLGWGSEIELVDVPWPEALPRWWSSLPEDERTEALFSLWHCVGERGWNDAPVVLTEADEWKKASGTRWLNEEPPTDKEPSGAEIAGALAEFLPRPAERVPAGIRLWVNRTENEGTRWLKGQHRDVKLASVVRRACTAAEEKADVPLVELVEWAVSRGDRRQDLVPLVLTEAGAREPSQSILADPMVEGGISRRRLFPSMPALIEDYAIIGDPQAVVLFLERLGVGGGGALKEASTWVGRYDQGRVAALIGCEPEDVEPSNNSGYTVLDYDFLFEVDGRTTEALQDWLSREHAALRGKGRRSARSHYSYQRTSAGKNPTSWLSALQGHPWVLCGDGQRRKPGDVLLEADLDFEDAPIAVIDAGLAARLTEEGLVFGAGISKSPALRRLALRAAADMPDAELAALLIEAGGLVRSGEVSRDDLMLALAAVRLRGQIPLSRLVQRSGAGSGLRGDLGGWVVALSELDPSLAAVLVDFDLSIPATTSGQHAQGFLDHVWEHQPTRVEEIRRHLASAYRYLLDDAEADNALARAWQGARVRARLYGGRSWHPISPELAVDDVQSPLIRRFLPDGRVIVASAHLGDTNEQVRRVAGALGLGLLSEEVAVRRGQRVDDPSEIEQLKVITATLSLLEDRRPLQQILFYDALALRVGGADHSIAAYVDDPALLLVGQPREFAVEAAGQLVEYFQLSQRGSEVAWLTGALFGLGDEEAFQRNMQVLADGLGVRFRSGVGPAGSEPDGDSDADEPDEAGSDGGEPERPDGDDTQRKDGHSATGDAGKSGSPDQRPARGGGTAGGGSSGGHGAGGGSPGGTRHGGTRGSGSGAGKGTKGKSGQRKPAPGGRAADHFRMLLVNRDEQGDPDSEDSESGRGGKKDDHKARMAVVEYESMWGRQAEAMDDNQPGFDVLSVDDATGRRRRIEIKGVQGLFEEDASVVLTARQVHDAIQNEDEGIEYWLYVVDSTETEHPRVFPIPWTRHRTHLRYGFYASAWAGDADQPSIAKAGGLTELSLEAMEPLDAGDLDEDWAPEDEWED